jgi:hypothetical protein
MPCAPTVYFIYLKNAVELDGNYQPTESVLAQPDTDSS